MLQRGSTLAGRSSWPVLASARPGRYRGKCRKISNYRRVGRMGRKNWATPPYPLPLPSPCGRPTCGYTSTVYTYGHPTCRYTVDVCMSSVPLDASHGWIARHHMTGMINRADGCTYGRGRQRGRTRGHHGEPYDDDRNERGQRARVTQRAHAWGNRPPQRTHAGRVARTEQTESDTHTSPTKKRVGTMPTRT